METANRRRLSRETRGLRSLVHCDVVLLARLFGKLRCQLSIACGLTGVDNVSCIRPENFPERGDVVFLGGGMSEWMAASRGGGGGGRRR